MKFEWDEAKDQANREKHGISFDTATLIFDGPVLTWIDDRRDYIEIREISIGALLGSAVHVLVVVHTNRRNKTRLISARKASRQERKRYYDHLREET